MEGEEIGTGGFLMEATVGETSYEGWTQFAWKTHLFCVREWCDDPSFIMIGSGLYYAITYCLESLKYL